MRAHSLWVEKNGMLIALLVPICIGVILLNNLFGVIVVVLVIGVIGFMAVAYVAYKYPQYNVLVLLSFNSFICLLVKIFGLYEIPLGIANDGFCIVMMLALILNKKISGLKTFPGILLTIWVLYLTIELLNPNSNSQIAGLLAIRSWSLFISSYFIVYSYVESKYDINLFLFSWLFIGFCGGLYGLWQEWVGVPSYDFLWATADEEKYGLFFTWGRLRKFSFFFSATEFGMFMSFTGVAALITTFYAKELKFKILAAMPALVCLLSMIYSGSRTAIAVLPIGLLVFAVVTLNRRVLIVVGFIFLLGTAFILRPSSGALLVMSTAFSADDPSMNVRIKNREIIRSYIQSNPIGYGLGGTGYLGHIYSPDTFIGTFATDSEFVRFAVEIGWLGLLLWILFLSFLFSYAVVLYFKQGAEEYKSYITGILVIFMMVTVAHYTQEIFVSPSITIVFAGMIGILAKIGSKVALKSKRTIIEE